MPLYDVARDDAGAPLLVMRLVEGRPLHELIAAAATLDERLALLPRVIPAVEAVAYAHRLGVVHRDLKPSNILVGELGDTVVIDWGLATSGAGGASVPDDGLAGTVFGTPGFMAPEQARGETADHRADVFALGATLFYTLTGKRPFEGDSATRLIAEASARPARPLAVVEPGVPRDLATIVDKALAHAAADRYPTAERLAADLRDFLAGRLVSAHHYPARQRIVRFVARHRAAVAAVAIAAVVVAATATVAVRRVVAARDRARAALADATRARAAETARADELLETQAEAVLATDPTRAIALLALRSRRGDAVERALVADAVGRGVASSWAAHDGFVTGLIWLGDGAALSAGWDGRVVWHDGRGGAREVRRFADGPLIGPEPLADGGAVVGSQGQLVRVDARGAVIAAWPTAGDTRSLAAGAGWIAWADRRGLHARELATGAARDLAGTELGGLAAGAGGAIWIHADGPAVRALDLATGAVRPLVTGRLEAIDGSRALVRAGDELVEVDAAPGGAAPRRWPIGGEETVLYADGAPVVLGSTTLRRPGGAAVPLPTHGLGLTAAGPGVLAIAQDRDVALIYGDHVAWLRGNPAPVTRLAFDARGRALLCATFDGRVTRWDLTARAAARADLTGADVNQLAALGPDRYAAVDATGGVVVVGPDGLHRHDALVQLLAFARYAAADGGRALAVLGPDGVVRGARGGAPFTIARGVKVIAPLTDGAIATLAPDGAIAEVALAADGAATPLGALGAPGRGLYARAGSLLAIGDGGTLWRRGPGGAIETAALARPVTGAAYLRADGGALIGVERGVIEWPAHGAPRARAAVDGVPVDLRDDGQLLVTTDGGAVWAERAGALAPLLAADANRLLPALAAARVVYVDGGTRVRAIDPASGVTTELPIDAGFVTALRALDGGRTVVVSGGGRVFEWRDPAPAEPDAFLRWRATLTNAVLASPRAALTWR